MTEQAIRVFCPTCNESSIDTGVTRCAWCDGELLTPERKERKRRRHSKISDLQVQQAYDTYLQGHSVNQIAAVIWERLGFASLSSCASSLHREFKLAGLPLRSQSSVTIKRNFKHGKATRAGGDEGAYRRWFKTTHGRYNDKCEKCSKPAMDGDTYCFGHSPAVADRRTAHLIEMRKTSPIGGAGSNHLRAKLTEEDVAHIKAHPEIPGVRLAEQFGVTPSTISVIRRGKNWAHVEPEVAA